MKAIVRTEYGSPEILELREIAKPSPTDDEVLVRIRASSVNMADVDYLLGRPKIARLGTGPRRQGTVVSDWIWLGRSRRWV